MNSELRLLVHQRDRVCTKCGSVKKLETHHIIPVSKGGTDELSNLTLLCRKCHRVVEPPRSIKPEERIAGFTVIRIKNEDLERLAKYGKYGDSVADALSSALDKAERKNE